MILLLYSFRCKPAGENYPPHFLHYTLITRLLDTFEFLLLLRTIMIHLLKIHLTVILLISINSAYSQNDSLFKVINPENSKTISETSCIRPDKIDSIIKINGRSLNLEVIGIVGVDTVVLKKLELRKANSTIDTFYILHELVKRNRMILASGKHWVFHGYATGKHLIYSWHPEFLQFEYNLKKGYLEGPFFYYYPGGNIMVRGKYHNNAKKGKWKYYHQNGKVAYSGKYRAKLTSYYPNNNFDTVFIYKQKHRKVGENFN
jgi:hypothetical protein